MRFEVLTLMITKSSIFACSPSKMNLLRATFLLGLFFQSEDGGDMFLGNVR
jgi:hypothetical protein